MASIPSGPMKNNWNRNFSSSTMMIMATMTMIMYISVLRTIYYECQVFKQTYIHFKTLLRNIVVQCNIFSCLSFSIYDARSAKAFHNNLRTISVTLFKDMIEYVIARKYFCFSYLKDKTIRYKYTWSPAAVYLRLYQQLTYLMEIRDLR
jgi:hypothetical protein